MSLARTRISLALVAATVIGGLAIGIAGGAGATTSGTFNAKIDFGGTASLGLGLYTFASSGCTMITQTFQTVSCSVSGGYSPNEGGGSGEFTGSAIESSNQWGGQISWNFTLTLVTGSTDVYKMKGTGIDHHGVNTPIAIHGKWTLSVGGPETMCMSTKQEAKASSVATTTTTTSTTLPISTTLPSSC